MIKKIFDYLILKGKTISFAESCSGGNLSLSITKIAGASKVFKGSIVSYSTYSKEKVIGIGRNEIDSFSPVSQEIAVKMAEKVKEKFNSDYSISITGNAGPFSDGTRSSVGDCFIAISSENEIFCEKYEVITSREDFIKTVTEKSFKLFIDKIINQ
ncbi:MAG: CinA family protein [Cryomorphaceae bacterium]|jgi:nicotinamide-nucleotide amidase|nr:CinA family protein [Cryomorphaceae bacterium]MDG1889453.1 CinA family protein [Flavobacteriaceae bacterium]MBT3503093.1 CinA family protein [Cryomorphaceae bacterium]MBT3689614.1 CinA family protein [Cryomorphaceae bacterium]MBT4221665.1 CinA family protein [Cryomorphaceae bacterium]